MDGVYMRSRFQPPNYVFSIAWAIIYVLYAFGWHELVRRARMGGLSETNVSTIDFVFAVNLLLGVSWVFAFFLADQQMLSVVILVALVAVICVQIWMVAGWSAVTKSTTSSQRALPIAALSVYLAWAVYATFLNMTAYGAGNSAPLLKVDRLMMMRKSSPESSSPKMAMAASSPSMDLPPASASSARKSKASASPSKVRSSTSAGRRSAAGRR
jgi:tryptophan-rich sensory protein